MDNAYHVEYIKEKYVYIYKWCQVYKSKIRIDIVKYYIFGIVIRKNSVNDFDSLKHPAVEMCSRFVHSKACVNMIRWWRLRYHSRTTVPRCNWYKLKRTIRESERTSFFSRYISLGRQLAVYTRYFVSVICLLSLGRPFIRWHASVFENGTWL